MKNNYNNIACEIIGFCFVFLMSWLVKSALYRALSLYFTTLLLVYLHSKTDCTHFQAKWRRMEAMMSLHIWNEGWRTNFLLFQVSGKLTCMYNRLVLSLHSCMRARGPKLIEYYILHIHKFCCISTLSKFVAMGYGNCKWCITHKQQVNGCSNTSLHIHCTFHNVQVSCENLQLFFHDVQKSPASNPEFLHCNLKGGLNIICKETCPSGYHQQFLLKQNVFA